MSSLRERALAGKNVRSEIVTVPDWGGEVKLVGLTAAERLRLVKRATVIENGDEKVDNSLLYPLLIIHSAHDPESGAKLFSEGDAETIMTNDAGTIEGVAGAVLRISGMTKDAQRVIAKNSVPTHSAAIASGSPKSSD
jgi:hypothetical protein